MLRAEGQDQNFVAYPPLFFVLGAGGRYHGGGVGGKPFTIRGTER